MASCPICRREAERTVDSVSLSMVSCSVCGDFRCTESAMAELERQTDDPGTAPKAAAFIKEQNLRGIVPTFDEHPRDYPRTATLEEAVAAYPHTLTDRVSRTISNLRVLQGDFDGIVELRHGQAHAYCFAKDSDGMARFIRSLEGRGLVEGQGSTRGAMRISLTMAGWDAAEKHAVSPSGEHPHAETGAPATTPQSDASGYEYDVVLSFAGEQREYVEEVAEILRRQGL